ncbi:MAG: transcriptional repressor [Symploca sp. SIO3C6]|nr:transcriptional repressor [Symploca sp. SIO3C6]NET07759.1 transcriptional repressor [Symploca sp. SIO2B6]
MSARRTESQERIIKLLKQLKREVSAQELFVELRKRKQTLGLATVYRSLKALAVQGLVQTRTLASGESLYSLLNTTKHHLTCLQCGDSIALEDCPACNMATDVPELLQFKVYYHTFELFGLCYSCQQEVSTEAENATETGRWGEGERGRKIV